MTDNGVSQARVRFSRPTVAAFAALVVLSTAGMKGDARHASSFVAVDLGTLDPSVSGVSTSAFDVSKKGLVVGSSTVNGDSLVFHAFVWSARTGMTDLGTLGGILSAVTVINDNGVIAGFTRSNVGGPARAFVRTFANVDDLSTLGGSDTTLTAMNAKGDIVGSSNVEGDAAFHAFLWTRQDGMRDLGTLGGLTSIANAISDDGVVVGESATLQDNVPHAFMWTRHTGMVDLGTLGGLTSVAHAVNNDGVIVGSSQTNQVASDGHAISHAFVWTRRTRMVDIRPDGPESFGEKISGRFVIGQTFTPEGAKHGFAWTQKMGFVDIGTLGGDRSFAAGVSDSGIVVGNSSTPSGVARAFMWSASSGIVELESREGTSLANAINGNFIVGSSCDAGDAICHATLWKPAPHSRKDRSRDDNDDD